MELRGVLSVLVTPFDDGGGVDERSLARMVEHNLAWGVDGVVCFGLAGELYKLTDDERRRVLDTVVHAVAGAVPIVAGTEHSGTEAMVQRSAEAVEAGASALMLYPPTFVTPTPAQVVDYYAAVAAATPAPVVIQDAPAWTRVPLPVDLLAEIRRQSPTARYVKVEAPPTAPKVRRADDAGFDVIGGYGALHLAEELDAGIIALMPGCSLPGLFAELWRRHRAHDQNAVWDLYARALPLLAFQMGSLDLFVAVQKKLLHTAGVIASPALRRPGAGLEPGQQAWLDTVMKKTGLEAFLGQGENR